MYQLEAIFQTRLDRTLQRVSARVTSRRRTRAQNAAVGGAAYSQHLIALAADLVPVAGSSYATIAAAARSAGLVPVIESDHVHVQLFPAGLPFVARLIDLLAA